MEFIGPLLLQFTVTSPLFITWIVGIVLAALRLREDPTRFRLTLVALVLLLAAGIAGQTVSLVLPISLQRNGVTPAQLGLVLGWVALANTLVQTGAWVLLLVALFRRSPGQHR